MTELKRDNHTSLPGLIDDLEPHDHLCHIYESREEWLETVVPFTLSGLKRGEKCIYIIDAGTAIHRLNLHEETLRQLHWLEATNAVDIAISSSQELEAAYDTTIEGWGQAMELRDHQTNGHTCRVADITIKLARAMGMEEEKLDHIRRGALLHDVGKIGIPDAILFKPGKLTEEEWEIMRRHPVMVYNMLSSIEYLRPALPKSLEQGKGYYPYQRTKRQAL